MDGNALNIDASTLPVYPLVCDERAGARALKCHLDFSKNQSYVLNLGYATAQNLFRTVRSIYLDNSTNAAEVVITADTGYRITAPANSQGIYGVVVGSPFNLTFASTGGVVVDAWLYNYCVEPSVWILGNAPGQIVISVPNFGAIGDGVADDTSAIQSAIAAAAAAGGGTVYFPPGKYKITSALLVDGLTPLTLRGAGYDPQPSTAGTIIANAGTGDAIAVNPAHAPALDTEIVFADFRLDGTAASGNGVSVYQHNGVRLDNVWIDGHGANGVYAEMVARLLAVHTALVGNSQSGMYAHSCSYVIALDSLSIGNSQSGSGYANLWFDVCSHVIVEASRVANSLDAGVVFSACTQVAFFSGRIDAGAGDGLRVVATNGYVIESIEFTDCIMRVQTSQNGRVGTNSWIPATAGKTTGWNFDSGQRCLFEMQNIMSGPGTVQKGYGAGMTNLDGQIGIGKIPAFPLDVGVAGSPPQIAAQFCALDGTANSEVRVIFNEGSLWFQGIGAGYNGGQPFLAFACGSSANSWTERMRIAANGNVAVGNANPQFKLDVSGDINTSGALRVNGTPIALGSPQTPWATDIDGATHTLSNMVLRIQGSLNRSTIYYQGDGSAMRAGLQVCGLGDQSPTSPVILTPTDNGGTPRNGGIQLGGMGSFNSNAVNLVVSGNFGAGVVNPVYPVDVSGDLNISGAYRIQGTPLLGGSWRSNAGAGGATLISPARALGVSYQNNTGRLLYVCVTAQTNPGNQNLSAFAASSSGGVSGNLIGSQYQATTNGLTAITFMVPANFFYMVSWSGGTTTLNQWNEWY
jgi:hypothetical protein